LGLAKFYPNNSIVSLIAANGTIRYWIVVLQKYSRRILQNRYLQFWNVVNEYDRKKERTWVNW
jgi:hypothetical protein